MDHGGRPSLLERHVECRQDEIRAQVLGHCPSTRLIARTPSPA
jgi:hypothetical protein